MLRITIDTNVILSGFDGTARQQAIFCRLQELHQQNIIDVAVTNRFTQDKETDSDRDQARRDIAAAAQFTIIASPFRMGLPQNDGFLVDDKTALFLNTLFSVTESTKKNTLWDIDHLYGHLADKRDFFLTYEKRGILHKAPFLAEIGIYVVNPDIFITIIDQIYPLSTTDSTSIAAQVKTILTPNQLIHPDPQMRVRIELSITTFNVQRAVEEAKEAVEEEKERFVALARNIETEEGKAIHRIAAHLRNGGVFSDELAFRYACDAYADIVHSYTQLQPNMRERYPTLQIWIDAQYEPFTH